MESPIPPHRRPPRSVFVILIVVLAPTAVKPADPPAEPTPRPGTLGARARTVTLDREALGSDHERIVLDNDAVSRIGKDASLTLGAVEPANPPRSQPGGAATTAEGARWRAAHRKQRRFISELERRRALIEIEVDHLENQRMTIRTMARLQSAEARLQLLDREIAEERAELARIVREARRHGAEPGWFR